MKYTIAIQADDYTNKATPDKYDASSPLWAELLEKKGHNVRWVDVYRPDTLDQLKGCQGFMWRWAHFGGMGRIARRLLPVIENSLGLAVYPDQNTCWHYDDKIAQAYLLKAKGIPTPKTWIWFDYEEAKKWAEKATYPLVLKLFSGAGSSNVRLIKDIPEANLWIDRLFKWRFYSLKELSDRPLNLKQRLKNAGSVLLKGHFPGLRDTGLELQSGYLLFQEFLSDNRFDTRVIVIGNRAWAFRRFNRKDDFRASGSGLLNKNPKSISLESIKLAFNVSTSLQTQCIGIDILEKDKIPLVVEISYTFTHRPRDDFPGYWNSNLEWVEGQFSIEEAQVEGFLKKLNSIHNN